MTTHGGILLVIVTTFLGLVCPGQGFNEQVTHTDTIQGRPSEETLTSLLRQHQATTAALLIDQEVKWSSLIREQEDKTASLLRELENTCANVLREQQAEMASQATELVNMKSQLRQQGKRLSNQGDALRQQRQKMSHQDSLLWEQDARLSYQEALLQQQERIIQQLTHRHVQWQPTPAENLRQNTNMSQPDPPRTVNTSGLRFHDVVSRSDDAGSLEAVMSHISQKVTEMGADLQAFRTQTHADIQTLQNSNRQQDLAIQDAQSSTFVHWGSSTCSNLSHTVYSGVVGGSWYDYSGSASNHLCLTLSPVSSDVPIVGSWAALLYGAEYESPDSHLNKDPVCAVCRSTLSTTVMIPGTNVCTPGWHLQYSGFLMAASYDLTAGTEYICVDSERESTAYGDADEDGTALFFTWTRCGSLPCPPFTNNTVVTCAVCSM